MNYKAIFQKIFPSRETFREFQIFIAQRRAERERQKRMARLDEQRRAEMIMAVADDPEDDDFDAMADEIWEKAQE